MCSVKDVGLEEQSVGGGLLCEHPKHKVVDDRSGLEIGDLDKQEQLER